MRSRFSLLCTIAALLSISANAATFFSFTGSLATPEDVFEQTFTVGSTTNLIIRTWGFGGGTNAAGAVIPAGGFDPLIALFSGPVSTASIFTIAGNPAASADTLSLFSPNCPPAGTVAIGTGTGNIVCGDDRIQITGLVAGTYTLLLSDANYVPFAVNPGPPTSTLLSDGFGDLTGGVFQTCNFTSDGQFCITPTNNYAVDIVGSADSRLSLPEPGTFGFLAAGIAALAVIKKQTTKRRNVQ